MTTINFSNLNSGDSMSINSIELKNFTVFEDLNIDVSSNINIFIGENGTGKTNLLKAIYATCKISKDRSKSATTLQECFKCYDSVPLSKDKNNHTIDIFLRTKDDNKEIIAVSTNFDTIRIVTNDSTTPDRNFSGNPEKNVSYSASYQIHFPQDTSFSAIFIPSKDMLTHSKGLLAMSDKYREFPFDITLTNIIKKANQWKLKQTPELAISILPILEEMIDGKVIIENEEFFVIKNDGRKVNFAVEAEGFKKIGLLWQLLMNESITQDSILIWDEPEANLNPAFLPKLVQCLIELSRHNVQIFLSTHNYIFAKYFNVKTSDSDSVMFHGLYKDNDSVQCESDKNFAALKHNSIIEVFNQLLEEVYDLDLGD